MIFYVINPLVRKEYNEKIYVLTPLKRIIDYTTLRARAFLNESFLMDVWTLLLITCLLFMIHAITELNGISILVAIDAIIEDILKEGTELGILVCTLLLVYKFYKLGNQAKFEPKPR